MSEIGSSLSENATSCPLAFLTNDWTQSILSLVDLDLVCYYLGRIADIIIQPNKNNLFCYSMEYK